MLAAQRARESIEPGERLVVLGVPKVGEPHQRGVFGGRVGPAAEEAVLVGGHGPHDLQVDEGIDEKGLTGKTIALDERGLPLGRDGAPFFFVPEFGAAGVREVRQGQERRGVAGLDVEGLTEGPFDVVPPPLAPVPQGQVVQRDRVIGVVRHRLLQLPDRDAGLQVHLRQERCRRDGQQEDKAQATDHGSAANLWRASATCSA